MTRIVEELVARGHHVDVVTALPWYRHHRVDDGMEGSGRPAPGHALGHGQPSQSVSRAVTSATSCAAPSASPGSRRSPSAAGVAAGGWLRRADGVIAMSPPLTMGIVGRLVAWAHRCPLVFNIQDVFPDAAVATGAVTNRGVIAAASWLERISYRFADAVTVLSADLAANVSGKLPAAQHHKVHTIPNFVDPEQIRPLARMTRYRTELGIGDEPVVLYAGNVGFSQSARPARCRRPPTARGDVRGQR